MRIDDNEGVSASSKHLVFAYYVTGHGFGHATRIVEVVRHLIAAGHDVHVVIGAPDFVFTSEIQSPRLKIRKVLLDCGAVQADALTVDRLASLEKYVETAVIPRAEILETEVEWLHSIKADFVVSDVVPVACRAAADAGIRSVCVTNFRHQDFSVRFSTSSITVLSGRVTEWSEGRFGYSIHEANTSWGKTKCSTSVLQLDPNTWVLEYNLSSVVEGSTLVSLATDLLAHMMFQAAKNVNRELFWMFSASRNLIV